MQLKAQRSIYSTSKVKDISWVLVEPEQWGWDWLSLNQGWELAEYGVGMELGSAVWVGPHLWELGIRMAPSSPIQPVFQSRWVKIRPPILLSASRMVT